jgi:hypothetical protein
MGKFFDNMSGGQKLILLFGGFILLIAAIALFPSETNILADLIRDMLGYVGEFFRNMGSN